MLVSTMETNSSSVESREASSNTSQALPPDMVFGPAQIISISAYTPLFVISATLNLRVLGNLLREKERTGLTRLNQLLLHLVLADLSVSFLNGATPASFLVYFRSFRTNKTIFTTNQYEKMSCPSSIWRRDSNPQPLEHESSPITTRQVLPLYYGLVSGDA